MAKAASAGNPSSWSAGTRVCWIRTPRPSFAGRCHAVGVEANLFSRVLRIGKSYANSLGAHTIRTFLLVPRPATCAVGGVRELTALLGRPRK